MNNSFKELEKLHLEQFEKKSPDIKNKIEGETSSYKFIGDVLDLYFNKVMGVFVAMTGGEVDAQNNPDKPNSNPTD